MSRLIATSPSEPAAPAYMPTELNVPMTNLVITQCLAQVLNVVITASPSRQNPYFHSVVACHRCIWIECDQDQNKINDVWVIHRG